MRERVHSLFRTTLSTYSRSQTKKDEPLNWYWLVVQISFVHSSIQSGTVFIFSYLRLTMVTKCSRNEFLKAKGQK